MSQTTPTDAPTLAQALALTAELRALQTRLNDTIEQLCTLTSAPEFARVVAARLGARQHPGQAWSPQFLTAPLAEPLLMQPERGAQFGVDASIYTDNVQGLVHLLQQPQPRRGDAPFSLIVNHADFDGTLLSVILDARALLAGQQAKGKASWSVMTEITGSTGDALYVKLAWRRGEDWEDRTQRLAFGAAGVVAIEIDNFDPSEVNALDIHLMFNPAARGSLEIRRLTSTFTVTPRQGNVSRASDVFEKTP